jgi:hypothetical protein
VSKTKKKKRRKGLGPTKRGRRAISWAWLFSKPKNLLILPAKP